MFRSLLLIAALLLPQSAVACPAIGGIPDFNCDSTLQITILGDSLGYGIGDTKNNNQGGYVLRASNRLPEVQFNNFSVAGLRARTLVKRVRDTFNKGSQPDLLAALRTSDIVILDIGRNDRWLFGEPIATYRNLKRIRATIEEEVTSLEGEPPLVVTAVLMLPNRGSQGPWVSELNEIIRKGHRLSAPANLRFDQVSKRLLSKDQIHPTPQGYGALAKKLVRYLTVTLPPIMQQLRPDTD